MQDKTTASRVKVIKWHDTTSLHFNDQGVLHIPHYLVTVPLLLLLGADLHFETADLVVQTLGCPSYLHSLRRDFGGFGHRCLKSQGEQQQIVPRFNAEDTRRN